MALRIFFLQSLTSTPSFSEMMAPLSEQKPKIQSSKKPNQNKTKLPEGQTLVAVCGNGRPGAVAVSICEQQPGVAPASLERTNLMPFPTESQARLLLSGVDKPLAHGQSIRWSFQRECGTGGSLENTGMALTWNVSLFLFESDKQ